MLPEVYTQRQEGKYAIIKVLRGCTLKLSLYSVNSVLILYRTGNMQSAILLSFVSSSSIPPCGLQSTHRPMPCYISPYIVPVSIAWVLFFRKRKNIILKFLHLDELKKSGHLECSVKPGLHLNANANDICGQEARQDIWYIRTLFIIHRGSESTLHKHIVCELSLNFWQSTDSIRLFTEHSSHSQLLFASPRQHIYIEWWLRFRMLHSCSIHIQV